MDNPFSDALGRFLFAMRPDAPDFGESQGQQIGPLIRHAVAHVPLYRDLYGRCKIDIDTIKTIDDLWRLPAVSKPDFIRVGADGYVDERLLRGNLHTLNTSGSIGAALTLYATEDEALCHLASLWSPWLNAGVNANDRLFMMSARYLVEEVEPFRTRFVPVDMSIDKMVEQFQSFAPTVVIGLMESAALLSVELQRRNIRARHDVRALFVFGQMYSEQLRRMVRRGFDAETFVLYGSTETGWMAFECDQHNGLHVMTDRNVLQIARSGHPDEPAAPDEAGEVIVTSLLRSASPIIRYRLHDIATIDSTPCPCGRRSPRLTKLEGREQDFLLSSDGRWIGPSGVVLDLVIARPDFLDFRIVQSSPAQVRVSLVLASAFDAVAEEHLKTLLQRRLGPVKIDIEIVDEIPREASGKRRRVYRTFDLPES
jgi:phenylacetate-CoA ligase